MDFCAEIMDFCAEIMDFCAKSERKNTLQTLSECDF
jgi:hypothetical protein